LAFLFGVLIFSSLSASAPDALNVEGYTPAVKVAEIKDESIDESSGLVASRTSPGAYWTHNDSGDGPFIYAFNTRGESLATYRVTGATNRDWEDVAAGPGPQQGRSYLYIGDIGDNDAVRSEVIVYRVPEPELKPTDKNSSKKRPLTTEPAEAIRLVYPDGKHDAETLLVHPTTGNLYILTKVAFANPTVYEAPAPLTAGNTIRLKKIGQVHVPSLFGGALTGGSVSPDGRRVALCDYFQGYELTLPPASTNFDDIWKQKMTGFDLGKRKQGEAVTYRIDGRALLATSEGKHTDLFQVELGRRRSRM